MTSIKAYNVDTRDFEYVRMNDTGLLISGGSSGGGDASSANQVLQLNAATNSNLAIYNQLSTQTDRVLYDTDLIYNQLVSSNTVLSSIDVSCNNMEVVLDNYTFTSGNLHVRDDRLLAQQQGSNIAQFGKLELIEQGTEISSGYLQSIDTLLTPLQQGIAKYTLDATTTLAPDTVPSYTAPPSGIDASEGWYYKNTSAGNTSQLYYYANQASQAKNFDYEIATVQSQWAVVRILSLNSATGLPFLVVYSQPQGTGDHLPGFARSSWVYQISSSAELRLGEKIIIYRGTPPDVRIFPELRRVECVLSGTRGPALTTEKLSYATVNTDSGSAIGNAEYIISGAGLTFLGDHVYKVELTAEPVVAGGDASSANQVASNLAVCARLDTLALINGNLDQLAYSGSNLLVSDSRVLEQLQSSNLVQQTILEILGDSVPVVNYGLLNDTPQYIPIKANSTGNLFVYDAEMHNLISPLVAFDRLQCEIPVSDGKLDTIINNMTLTNFNVNNLTKCDTDNVAIPGGVDINNLPTIQQVSLGGEAVSISGTVPISSGSPLDVHCFGSSNGVEFHHLKTNAQGILRVNSYLHVEENEGLTSELKTGTEPYNALHCWVKNSITLEAGSTTNITALDPIATKSQSSNNALIANDIVVNGPVSIGVADSDGYMWISAQIQLNECTSGGMLYLEYSAEGSVWFRGNTSSESVYVNPSVVQQRVLIRPQTPCTMRYVRVFGEGTFAATGVTAWVSMK
jgi:hypothetical protein